jgi:hypothetical protein
VFILALQYIFQNTIMLHPVMPVLVPFLLSEIHMHLKCAAQLIEMLGNLAFQYKKSILKPLQKESDKEQRFEIRNGILLFQSYLRKIESLAPYVILKSNKPKEQPYQQQTIIPDPIVDTCALLHVQY